jgi:serine O-acetyltransferase
VRFGYSGLGIVVHARARIGSHVVIGTNVTFGGRKDYEGVPMIEDGVEIGTSAKTLGPVTCGRGTRIGANAVVLTDIPPGATAVGVPARIIPVRT